MNNRIAINACRRRAIGVDVHVHGLRHTYCAARLQTLDGGYPVSVYTVAQELGHGGDGLVKAISCHLGTIRHRSEVVEYRVEHFAAQLGERLTRLRDFALSGTTGPHSGAEVTRSQAA